MSTATLSSPIDSLRTVADLIERLGDVPPERVRLHPQPGEAAIEDLIRNNDEEKSVLCELIDGVLVEKAPMSYFENRLAFVLAYFLHGFLKGRGIGAAFTEGAMYQMNFGNVRLPDISVCLKDKFPTGKVERVPFAEYAPDFAVEVLSVSNTRAEIDRKRRELFESGTRLIWVVHPDSRTVDVFTSIDAKTTLTENDTLTGGDVLPGFELSIREWFRQAEEV